MSTHENTEAQQQPDALVGRLKRTELQREPSSIAGREIVQVLTEIPAGVESGWHTHPGEEVGYIVEGTVEMMIKDRPTLRLHAGDGFLIPPGTEHNAYDVGRTRVECSRPTSSRWASRSRPWSTNGSAALHCRVRRAVRRTCRAATCCPRRRASAALGGPCHETLSRRGGALGAELTAAALSLWPS